MLSKEVNHPAIKICGLKDTDTILAMSGLPIQYVGLVFAPSKRQVSIEQGIELVQAIHQLDNTMNSKVEAVAVCVDMPLNLLKALVEYTKIDVVQLHGQEDAAYISALKNMLPVTKVWKALSIKAINLVEQQLETISRYLPQLDAVLIDAPGGGTGTVFNWEAINSFKQVCDESNCQLFVAGGLHEANVELLLNAYNVDGVDVSSGVETDGIKDINKIKRFVGKVRQ